MTTKWPAGQAAFVTGAASGIGLGMARAFVAAGMKVALADIDAPRLAKVEKELSEAGGTVVAVTLDVTDPDQWAAAADRAEQVLGPISILCNNAGANGGGALDQTPLDVWRWVHRINAEGQFIGLSTFLPRFKSRGGRAHIVNTASMAGIVPMAFVGAYSSAKFASFGLSMVLRTELHGTDIGVSVLCPGTVNTRISESSGEGEAKLLGTEVNTAAVEGNNALLAQGADPDRVGEQVLEAIEQGQFLIITHGDWWPLVDAVHTEIRTTFAEFDNRHGPDNTAQFLAQGISPVTT
ncbi:SDR family NAD(P)-dependent oxidoreductase [Mycolicibacterium fortuitum]|uniref:SDR family NAD(P)-dependent oxidoreductase n=1 Tax=Mycolicibacterium fortuitum TaxID=1766 RepID=UPI001AEFAB0F|nr:SDR family oxidoreductase [Mycolicibacterium fortuitum]MBP3086552.1 SDR family oxidoreductase [Mycolicibacterium fortuitum]